MTTEPRVHPMKQARTMGRTVGEIPTEWLPLRLHIGFPDVCGWWLCENEHAAPNGMTALHVLYCSLPHGHEGDCVWQNPTPKPVIS